MISNPMNSLGASRGANLLKGRFLETPYRYRRIDGTCNNLVEVEWGAAAKPYRRLLPQDYPDGPNSPLALPILIKYQV